MKKIIMPIVMLMLCVACDNSKIADENLPFEVDSVNTANQAPDKGANPENQIVDLNDSAKSNINDENTSSEKTATTATQVK